MTSTVQVVEEAGDLPFIVKRVSATRNYPAGPTPMTVEVRFSEDYSGDIIDVVPASFDLTNVTPAAESGRAEAGEAQLIVWNGSWRAGETAVFTYDYETPVTSPEFYTVGPLEIGDASEHRVWQIANDLAESYVYGGASNGRIFSTHLPDGAEHTRYDNNTCYNQLRECHGRQSGQWRHMLLRTGKDHVLLGPGCGNFQYFV